MRLAKFVASFLFAAPKGSLDSLKQEDYFGLVSQKVSSSSTFREEASSSPTVSLSVCVSPGCIADGAHATLEKMKALAPAHVHVDTGPCRSGCGAGPIVSEISNADDKVKREKIIHHKRVSSEDRMLKLLFPLGGEPKELIEGYNLALQGDAAFEQENFAQAISYYEQSLAKSFRPALQLQNELDHYEHKRLAAQTSEGDTDQTTSSRHSKAPRCLEWLVTMRRKEALAIMKLGDLDGAVLAIQASCNLSRNTSSESILVLAKVNKEKGDNLGELQALENLFQLPVNEDLSFQEVNQRRLAKLRLQKLQSIQRGKK